MSAMTSVESVSQPTIEPDTDRVALSIDRLLHGVARAIPDSIKRNDHCQRVAELYQAPGLGSMRCMWLGKLLEYGGKFAIRVEVESEHNPEVGFYKDYTFARRAKLPHRLEPIEVDRTTAADLRDCPVSPSALLYMVQTLGDGYIHQTYATIGREADIIPFPTAQVSQFSTLDI